MCVQLPAARFIILMLDLLFQFWQTGQKDSHVHKPPNVDADVEDASSNVRNILETSSLDSDIENGGKDSRNPSPEKGPTSGSIALSKMK